MGQQGSLTLWRELVTCGWAWIVETVAKRLGVLTWWQLPLETPGGTATKTPRSPWQPPIFHGERSRDPTRCRLST
ncbi:hypothetical protein CORC01_05440 [Colletotrichum orchidophilum]|uniref:Uncharacterized protein n=1 Tax=Colletotrichum orchidophilum TaxID=1209926 RepID=A0A1G4BCK6_9PEZI|nr:uncharacterized protein CORC01_05440 [Colletotrichum orchidophilum]OHE99159.1 hypothetical protein CORC01_05440 [Colletotrichum orchidophilum]